MENRIKEQYSLFAGRVSAATLRANQLRLYLSAAAYVLMSVPIGSYVAESDMLCRSLAILRFQPAVQWRSLPENANRAALWPNPRIAPFSVPMPPAPVRLKPSLVRYPG